VVVVLLVAAGAAWEAPALELLSARSDVVVLKRCVDVDDLLAAAASGQADVAVLGLDEHGLDGPAVDRLRRHGVRPVVVSPGANQIEAGRARAARIGVHSLVADDDLSALVDAVTAAEPDPGPAPVADSEEAPDPHGAGRVITVCGPLGAPGRTTVATGLAAELARRRASTALVDADACGGSVAQVLGILDEVSGLLAASRLAGAGELAARFPSVQRALDPWLTVVTGLPRPDRWTEVRLGTVETLLEVAAQHGHVVVDTGAVLDDDPVADYGSRPGRGHITQSALAAADELLVVGTADPVGLSRLARTLVDLSETAGSVPTRVVVNRMRPSLGWSERDVADMVAGFTRSVSLHFLPEDRVTVDRALVTGRTLAEIDPESPLVRAIAELTDAVVPDAGDLPARGGWATRVRRRTAR
jgi:MinD-like ATPase involved in chromosome partitioning or flagellar assembly